MLRKLILKAAESAITLPVTPKEYFVQDGMDTQSVDIHTVGTTAVWSGDDGSCCRTLTLDLASIVGDDTLPDHGIDVAELATTGYTFSRSFLGTTLYKSIATGYTLASATTGDKYAIGFDLEQLYVRVKAVDSDAQAQALLGDNGVDQTITLTCMGDVRSITGKAVVVQEPCTGLWAGDW